MMKRLIARVMERSILRRWTDRKVYCSECGEHVGYVVWSNRDEWTCDECAGRTRPYVQRVAS
jgi:formylmethanofuran dehydrogenase subunit E